MKDLNHIAFLDPAQVNESTCKGINCDLGNLIERLTQVFIRTKDKENVLLVYNYQYVFLILTRCFLFFFEGY